MFIAVLIIAGSIPVMGAKLPASKTEEQQALEDKEAQEQAVITDESVPVPEKVAVENLPEDTTPRYTLTQVSFSGNTLFTDEQLLEDMPDIYNTAKDGSIDSANLYDLRGLKAIAAVPGTEQTVSARSIQGFTQYILMPVFMCMFPAKHSRQTDPLNRASCPFGSLKQRCQTSLRLITIPIISRLRMAI
jgi:hypothetical protein